MSSNTQLNDETRTKILSSPEAVLDDKDLMHALVSANQKSMGHNVVDLRGIAMGRLETRLDRLEDTHRTVIAAAYENLAGTNKIHRAILRLLEAERFEDFLKLLEGDVADILRVDSVKLVLESSRSNPSASFERLKDMLSVAEPGFCETYITKGREADARQVTLRHTDAQDDAVFGKQSHLIHSEACLKLNLGAGRRPAILVLGSEDPHLFSPQHGTDLLAFFAGVFERMMRRWLNG